MINCCSAIKKSFEIKPARKVFFFFVVCTNHNILVLAITLLAVEIKKASDRMQPRIVANGTQSSTRIRRPNLHSRDAKGYNNETGVPQGFSLSPMLFNLAMAGLAHSLEPQMASCWGWRGAQSTSGVPTLLNVANKGHVYIFLQSLVDNNGRHFSVK